MLVDWPWTVSIVLWGLTALLVLYRWNRYRQECRAGRMLPAAAWAHVTADVVAVGVGFGLTQAVSALLVRWAEGLHWEESAATLYVLLFLLSLLATHASARLYRHLIDARLRRTLLTEPSDNQAKEEGDPA